MSPGASNLPGCRSSECRQTVWCSKKRGPNRKLTETSPQTICSTNMTDPFGDLPMPHLTSCEAFVADPHASWIRSPKRTQQVVAGLDSDPIHELTVGSDELNRLDASWIVRARAY